MEQELLVGKVAELSTGLAAILEAAEEKKNNLEQFVEKELSTVLGIVSFLWAAGLKLVNEQEN